MLHWNCLLIINTYKIVSKYFLFSCYKSVTIPIFLSCRVSQVAVQIPNCKLCFPLLSAKERFSYATQNHHWWMKLIDMPFFAYPIASPTTPFSLSNKTTFLPATQTVCKYKKASFLCRKNSGVCIVEFGFQKGYFLKRNGSVAGWCWWGYRLHVQDCDGGWLWGWKVSASESICEERIPHEIETHNWGGVSD